MISSLLSLYLASTIQADLNSVNISKFNQTENIISTAGAELNDLMNQNSAPLKNPQYISPIIDAEGIIALDLKSGTILYEKNPHKQLAIASITKLMTAYIILEENKLDETSTVSANAANTEGSTMFLETGEEITIENLLFGAMINSANDAAVALAEHNAGNVNDFVKKMNTKAQELGLTNTHFSNPIGLDDRENYSSVYDIAKISQKIYQKQFIRHAAKTKKMEVKSKNNKIRHKLESTNELLDSYLNIKGLKTGRTDAAGLCMVAVAENDQKQEIITVVLNSPARFKETKILVDWVFRAFKW